MSRFYIYPNRVVCSVLDEMRKQLQVLDANNLDRYKSSMGMLIEEAQTMVNRMEAALEDWDDVRRVHEKLKELKKEIKDNENK